MSRPVSEYEALCRMADDLAAIAFEVTRIRKHLEHQNDGVLVVMADRRRIEAEVRKRIADEWRAEEHALGSEV